MDSAGGQVDRVHDLVLGEPYGDPRGAACAGGAER